MPLMKHIFHIHTKRCKHASDENDEDYVKTALALEADAITFTDHSPFPDNPFGNRMDFEQLPEYINSLKTLQKKYQNKITVEYGLEVEFLPSKMSFYEELHKAGLFPLIIGQHFYEHPDGTYSFSDDKEFNKENEYLGCCKAMIKAIQTGFFSVAVHPDRVFRRCKNWTQEMTDISAELISTAAQNGVTLEQNMASYEKLLEKSNFIYWRKEFWDLVESYNQNARIPVKTIIGLDAHSTEDIIKRANYVSLGKTK